mgnify:CR=1 FL=1
MKLQQEEKKNILLFSWMFKISLHDFTAEMNIFSLVEGPKYGSCIASNKMSK